MRHNRFAGLYPWDLTLDTAKAPEAKGPLVPRYCEGRPMPESLRSAQSIELVVRSSDEAGCSTILAAAGCDILLQVVMRQRFVFV